MLFSLKILDSSKITDSPKIPALATFCRFQTKIYSVFESKHFTDIHTELKVAQPNQIISTRSLPCSIRGVANGTERVRDE